MDVCVDLGESHMEVAITIIPLFRKSGLAR
jgi:hypothetical protein